VQGHPLSAQRDPTVSSASGTTLEEKYWPGAHRVSPDIRYDRLSTHRPYSLLLIVLLHSAHFWIMQGDVLVGWHAWYWLSYVVYVDRELQDTPSYESVSSDLAPWSRGWLLSAAL
jgi:hypothetical protein